MSNAHDAIDKRISGNNLNPNNIKNKVNANTLDLYGLFEDFMFNQGTAIFKGMTEGGDNRFYKRGFTMPSSYADPSDEGVTKDQIMQLLVNSIRQSPDDTTSTQEIKDFYKLRGQEMPKYKEGGKVKRQDTQLLELINIIAKSQGNLYTKRGQDINALIKALNKNVEAVTPSDLGVKTPPLTKDMFEDEFYRLGVELPFFELERRAGNKYSGHKIR